jgi:uncharacterized UBP type Zn finger protein
MTSKSREPGATRVMSAASPCAHQDQIRDDVEPQGNGCAECLATGDSWVHLRVCLTCGHIGCCEDSKNQHAAAHFRATGHPIVCSFEPGESWRWCFVDETFLDWEEG